MTDYAESDYVYDDMLDQHPSHSQQVDQFGKEFKYGAYQAMLLGHKPGGFQLDDAGIFQRQSFARYSVQNNYLKVIGYLACFQQPNLTNSQSDFFRL